MMRPSATSWMLVALAMLLLTPQGVWAQEPPTTPQTVTIPENLQTETWTISGIYYDNSGDDVMEKTIQIGFNGNDVYLQGISAYMKKAWIKGTLSSDGKSITFATNQFLGYYEFGGDLYPFWFATWNQSSSQVENVTVTYDAEAGTITWPDNIILYESSSDTEVDPYGYYKSIVAITRGGMPEAQTPPEGLEANVKEYRLRCRVLNETTQEYKVFELPIYIAWDDNDVWVKGLCEDLSGAWAKGTYSPVTKKVTFTTGQFYGTIDVFNYYFWYYYFAGYDTINAVMADVVMTFDEETGKFTMSSPEQLLTNGAWKVFYSYHVYRDVTFVPTKDGPATPAQPEITNASIQDTTYPSIFINIPTYDVNGEPIHINELYYRFYYEINHEASMLTLSPTEYKELTSEMTEIPYTFSDDWDIYNYRFYLNMDFSTWNRVGIQSVYRGGNEEHTSEIFWYTLKPYVSDVTFNATNNLTIQKHATITVDGVEKTLDENNKLKEIKNDQIVKLKANEGYKLNSAVFGSDNGVMASDYTGNETWYGTRAESRFYWAVQFDPTTLTSNTLAAIRMKIRDANAGEPVTLSIYSDGNMPLSGTLLYSQEINFAEVDTYETHYLDKTVVFDQTKPLWLVLYQHGSYVASVGRNPVNTNAKIWTYIADTDNPQWLSNETYTPLVYAIYSLPIAEDGSPTFTMPLYDTTVSYTLKRDMTVKVAATVGDGTNEQSYPIEHNDDNTYQLQADNLLDEIAVSDTIVPTTPARLVMGDDYTVIVADADGNALLHGGKPITLENFDYAPGTYTLLVCGIGNYSDTIATNVFELYLRIPAEISYAQTFLNKDKGDVFVNTLTNTGDGEVTYTLAGDNIATIDPETGKVTITGRPGVVTVTATVEDSGLYSYETKSVTYVISVGLPLADPPYDYDDKSIGAHKLALLTVINIAKEIDLTNKTDKSANKLKMVIAECEKLLTSKTVTHEELDEARIRLLTAIDNLEDKAPADADADIANGQNQETTTGAKAVEGQSAIENWYTLNGRKLDKKPTKKGVYILNGKMVVIK